MVKCVSIYTRDTLKKDQQRTYQMVICNVFVLLFFSPGFLDKGIGCGYSFDLYR